MPELVYRFARTSRFVELSVTKQYNSDFLYYFLSTQYQQLRSVSAGDGGRGGLNPQIIRGYRIPVPPLEVQREIVNILDKFTALEAELEARCTQYEFYRDQKELAMGAKG